MNTVQVLPTTGVPYSVSNSLRQDGMNTVQVLPTTVYSVSNSLTCFKRPSIQVTWKLL